MFHHRLTKRFIWIAVVLIVFIAIVAFLYTETYPARVIIGGKSFQVEVVDTDYLFAKGLSERNTLSADEGMFFVFQNPSKHGFWMKDMKFSIDIIWIDENFIINHIEKSVSPNTYPKVFNSDKDSIYVLEVLAGEAEKLDIKIGDKVKFIKYSF